MPEAIVTTQPVREQIPGLFVDSGRPEIQTLTADTSDGLDRLIRERIAESLRTNDTGSVRVRISRYMADGRQDRKRSGSSIVHAQSVTA